MLYQKIEKIRENTVMHKITDFLDGNWYPVVYAALALICSFTGLELAFYVLTALVAIFGTIFCRDTKSLIVPLVLAVYAVSQKHTPQPPYKSDYLYDPAILATLGILFGLVFASTVFRMIAYKGTGNVFRTPTKARWGLFALGAVLILNGIFYSGYTIANLVLGIGIAFSFIYFYIYFYNTAEWTEKTPEYIARILVLACAVILIQLLEMFVFDQPQNKNEFVLGWGMSNNIGGMLAMFMPACFYLTYKSRYGVAYYIFGLLTFVGVVMTLSRTSVFVGGTVLVVCMILLSIKGRYVRFVRIFNIVFIVVLVCFVFVPNELWRVFKYYIEHGFNDSGRWHIWENGVKNFLRAPIFGVGFYTPIAPDWSYNIENWVFPDMYHNTYIQLLASCGILGVAAYTFHLVQGAILIFRKPSVERIFFFLVILILSGMSMADNHLFHIFPTLVYSMLIAMCEKDYEKCERDAKAEQTLEGGAADSAQQEENRLQNADSTEE